MDIDICQYDMRFKSLHFTSSAAIEDASPHWHGNDLVTKFVLKGSSENRPRVMMGDIIR